MKARAARHGSAVLLWLAAHKGRQSCLLHLQCKRPTVVSGSLSEQTL